MQIDRRYFLVFLEGVGVIVVHVGQGSYQDSLQTEWGSKYETVHPILLDVAFIPGLRSDEIFGGYFNFPLTA